VFQKTRLVLRLGKLYNLRHEGFAVRSGGPAVVKGGVVQVRSTEELASAVANEEAAIVEIVGRVEGVSGIRLRPGQVVRGADSTAALLVSAGSGGLCITRDNTIEAVGIFADNEQCAVYNDSGVESLGHLTLRDLTIRGCIRILARDRVRSGHIEMRNVDVAQADARSYNARPKGYGVEVIPGVIMIWNQQPDADVVVSAELTGLSVGRAGAPAHGSGVFVSGAGENGGRLVASLIETKAVYVDGGIAAGTPDRIAGGVFTVHGSYVDTVHNLGPVTTYGPNDMVLDNWGTVDHWIADGKITSYGPSGIGFVNFGVLDRLEVNAPIETFGRGARGFNVYAGTVHEAVFDRIVTRADGAVGIQISQPVGEIVVRRGIETFGGVGDSLVKGVVTKLPAIPFSLKPGGSARKVSIGGGLRAHGAGIEPMEIHGSIDVLEIRDVLAAAAVSDTVG
jgi:hypothetical protein